MDKRIVLLACKSDSTNIVFNFLEKQYGNVMVVMEERESMRLYLKRRIKKIGLMKVAGQLMFQFFIAKPLYLLSGKRIQQIFEENKMEADDIPLDRISPVLSINTDSAIAILQERKPDIIIVSGTRIISKRVLETVPCKFINIHAGITPKYRGVHGAYWSLVNNDSAHCGVTVHFVDKGIDTGSIIEQQNITVTSKDNFVTYPYLQLAVGLKLLHKAINSYFAGTLQSKASDILDSFLWYHPTLLQYLYNRLVKKVK